MFFFHSLVNETDAQEIKSFSKLTEEKAHVASVIKELSIL